MSLLITRAGLGLGLAFAVVAAPLWAADDAKDPVPTVAVQPTIHRASQLIGMSVQNAAGESIGTIDDVVIDGKTGQCRYLAISFGTTFGFGGKLFAVPFRAVEIRYDSKNDSHFVMFDVRKEQLERAPGFPKDKWPDFGNTQFTGAVDKYYEANGDRPAPERRKETKE